jgi:2,4-didehydro-3-deoxy-L-rhamnonate hydrolase
VRLGTVHHDGRDVPAVESGGAVYAVDDLAPDARTLIASGVVDVDLEGRTPLEGWTPRVPVAPGKIICVGTNYRDHVAEMEESTGVIFRKEPFPFGFLKPATALAADGADVRFPPHGVKLDWEAELAIVIGDASAATADDPLAAVYGYTILNDLSLRDWLPFPHALGLDAIVAKAWDGAAPLGPWITTADAVADPQDLPVKLWVNGTLKQDSSTAQMIFDLRTIVSHYLGVFTLEPGDVIATGTPAGVGAGRKPQEFLAPGDRVEIEIGDLGRLTTSIEGAA